MAPTIVCCSDARWARRSASASDDADTDEDKDADDVDVDIDDNDNDSGEYSAGMAAATTRTSLDSSIEPPLARSASTMTERIFAAAAKADNERTGDAVVVEET